MDDRQQWKRSRYASLLAVLAVHTAVLMGFLMTAKTRFAAPPTSSAIELLNLPRNVIQPTPPPPASPDRQKKPRAVTSTLPTDSLTVVPTTNGDASGNGIDWAQEAHDAAASFTKREKGASTASEPASKSAFAPPPAHYKGEQIPTADGRWMVFVSDNCYQMSNDLTHITNATNTGVAIQTYCNRHSNKARGDLFEQLPAYKKYHPDK
jgi:septal ring-binding cell division protein DamX